MLMTSPLSLLQKDIIFPYLLFICHICFNFVYTNQKNDYEKLWKRTNQFMPVCRMCSIDAMLRFLFTRFS